MNEEASIVRGRCDSRFGPCRCEKSTGQGHGYYHRSGGVQWSEGETLEGYAEDRDVARAEAFAECISQVEHYLGTTKDSRTTGGLQQLLASLKSRANDVGYADTLRAQRDKANKERDALAARHAKLLDAIDTLWSLTVIEFEPMFKAEGKAVMRTINKALDDRDKPAAPPPAPTIEPEKTRGPPLDAMHAAARALVDAMEDPDRTPLKIATAVVQAYLAYGNAVSPTVEPEGSASPITWTMEWPESASHVGYRHVERAVPWKPAAPTQPSIDAVAGKPSVEDVARMMYAEIERYDIGAGAPLFERCQTLVVSWINHTTPSDDKHINSWSCAPAIRALIDRERAKRAMKRGTWRADLWNDEGMRVWECSHGDLIPDLYESCGKCDDERPEGTPPWEQG